MENDRQKSIQSERQKQEKKLSKRQQHRGQDIQVLKKVY